MKLKALSLLQPWATLVVTGQKRIETRSKGTDYRGPLAIHASGQFPAWARNLSHEEPYFAPCLQAHRSPGLKMVNQVRYVEGLPLGAIVGLVEMVDCVPMGEHPEAGLLDILESLPACDVQQAFRRELAFGDYRPGRYMYLLSKPRYLPLPILARGALGLWEVDLPGNMDLRSAG